MASPVIGRVTLNKLFNFSRAQSLPVKVEYLHLPQRQFDNSIFFNYEKELNKL